MWEMNLRENGCVYMYNQIILLWSRNDHNIVDQLYFNKTLRKKKKELGYLELSTSPFGASA